MSYEPTQPMTPPSTSLDGPRRRRPRTPKTTRDDRAPGRRGAGKSAPQGGWGQGSASEGGVSQATVPRAVLSHGNVAAPRGDAAPPVDAPQARRSPRAPTRRTSPTDPRPRTRTADAAPESAARRNAGPMPPRKDAAAEARPRRTPPQRLARAGTTNPTGDWASEYSAAWRQGNASDSDRYQGNDPQGDWAQGNGPQGDWATRQQGYGPQGYGPQGYGPGTDMGPQGDWDRGNAQQRLRAPGLRARGRAAAQAATPAAAGPPLGHLAVRPPGDRDRAGDRQLRGPGDRRERHGQPVHRQRVPGQAVGRHRGLPVPDPGRCRRTSRRSSSARATSRRAR